MPEQQEVLRKRIHIKDKLHLRSHIATLKSRLILATKEGRPPLELRRYRLKIAYLSNELAIIQDLEGRIVEIDKLIKSFFGYSVSKITLKPTDHKEKMLHKQIFYRYGLENGIYGEDLAEYAGDESPGQASICRKLVMKNREKSETYKKFLDFIKTKTK